MDLRSKTGPSPVNAKRETRRTSRSAILPGHVSRVFTLGSEEKVIDVHATWDVAPMENTKPFRNRADYDFPRHPVSKADFFPKIESSVAVLG